ncbi:tyrosine-type recombinase/integrase [Botrimarina mediterranea]|uniref:tyrosine-type recombinase/integrase n=1 Tax=Botrimarina mediterranea TaxID=2528022 RepID=UPI00118C9626|nr:site-specific tyrosine recombinase XerD [Planctomycetes bacterium K2D]
MQPLRPIVAAYYQARGGKPKTITLANCALRRFEEYLGREATTADLTDTKLRGWCNARRNQGATMNTVNGEANKILAIWRWHARGGQVPPPDFVAPPKEHKLPRALSREDLQTLSRTALNTRQMIRGVPGNIYWPALIWTCYHTAERIGAVRQLSSDCIDPRTGWIVFRSETRKGQRAEIARRVSAETMELVCKLLELNLRAPFDPVGNQAWYPYWSALRAESGLPEWLTPHRLRSSAASHLKTPEDAMRLLGHKSIATTIASYRDPRIVKEPSLIKALEKPKPNTLAEKLANPTRSFLRRLGWTG